MLMAPVRTLRAEAAIAAPCLITSCMKGTMIGLTGIDDHDTSGATATITSTPRPTCADAASALPSRIASSVSPVAGGTSIE